MNKKIFAIIGALLFVAAVVVGQFANFAAANIVEIALASFALVSVIISVIDANRKAGTFTWKTILIIVLAIIAGALVCVGGVHSSIFEQISGLVVALIALIIGLVNANKTNTN